MTLQNSGKLGFAFAVLSPSTGTAASPLPGVPLVVPSTVSSTRPSPGLCQAAQERVLGGKRENEHTSPVQISQERQGCERLLQRQRRSMEHNPNGARDWPWPPVPLLSYSNDQWEARVLRELFGAEC